MNYVLKPWKHQEKAIEKAVPLPEFAFLFEVGAGKTGACINTIRYKYAEARRVMRTFILCPIVVCDNWKDEFEMHSRVGKHVHVMTGPGKKRLKLMKSLQGTDCIIVTNYESLSMKELYAEFVKWGIEIIVSDESQKIKSANAKRTKLAITLADRAKYRYIMTGTSITNTPMDVWAQFRFLDGGASFEKNYYVFRSKYFYDKNAGMPSSKHFPDWQPLPGMDKIFNSKIYSKAMRVKKEDCLDLPPFVRQKLYTKMNAEQTRMYKQMKAQFIAYLNDKACVATIALTKALRLQQIVSGFFVTDEGETIRYENVPRLKVLIEAVKDLAVEHKVIVWACFKENYAMISKELEKEEIDHAYLIGGMSDKARRENIEAFREDPSTRVMIANQAAGGVGINLIESSYSVYYTKNFSLEQDLQSEARNYRGGSEMHKKVTRIDLVCKGTIDEHISDSLEAKQDMSENILAFKERFLS